MQSTLLLSVAYLDSASSSSKLATDFFNRFLLHVMKQLD
jgi:hypothetical protein